MDSMSLCLVPGWIALHALALMSAWGTRLAASPRVELAVQFCFLAAMVAVGAAAWISQQQEPGLCVPSAVILVAMVLTAVTDFSTTEKGTEKV